MIRGDLTLIAAGLAALGAVITWKDIFEAKWLARVDERYASSRLVLARLRRRERRRRRIRRMLPVASRVARVTSSLIVGLICVALVLTAIGITVPDDPPWWLRVLRLAAHAVSWLAVGSLGFALIARRAVREWDRAAGRLLCASPVVTGAEIGTRLDREGTSALARLLLLAPLVVTWLT